MQQLDTAVRHVLTLKYLAGMFAHPYTNPNRVNTAELTPANLAAAKQSADESQVLLENHNNALPLSPSTSSIAVVGPLANDAFDQLGPDVPIGYDTTPADLTTTRRRSSRSCRGSRTMTPGATVNYARDATSRRPQTASRPRVRRTRASRPRSPRRTRRT